MTNYTSPFPTIGEIVNFIINAFGGFEYLNENENINISSKYRKESERIKKEEKIDLENAEEILSTHIKKILSKILDKNSVKIIDSLFENFIRNYKKIVLNVSISGADRKTTLFLLSNCFFIHESANLIHTCKLNRNSEYDFPSDDFWYLPSYDEGKIKYPIEKVLNWFVKYSKINSLKELARVLENKQDARVSDSALYKNFNRWKNNKNLPKPYHFQLFLDNDSLTLREKKSFVISLFIARLSQSIHNSISKYNNQNYCQKITSFSKEIVSLYLTEKIKYKSELNFLMVKEKIESVIESKLNTETKLIDYFSIILKSTNLNEKKEKGIEKTIGKCLGFSLLHGQLNTHSDLYQILWRTARFYPLSDNFELALNYYIKVFNRAKYCAGKDTKKIIREGFTLASYLVYNGKINANNSDVKNFYKWGMYYDLFNEPFNDVKEYIFDQQRKSFFNIFKIDAFYQSVLKNRIKELKQQEYTYSGCYVIDDKKKPDINNPNKIADINFPRPISQLIYFILKNDFESVKSLLKAGANPNFIATDGSTPLIHSLSPNNKNITRLLLKYDLSKSINSQLKMKKDTALLKSLGTGYPLDLGIIRGMIKVGADINKIGTADAISPLYALLSRFAICNNPDLLDLNNLTEKDKVKALSLNDVFRKRGALFDDDFINISNEQRNNPRFVEMSEIIKSYLVVKEEFPTIYKVLDILLKSGANVNQKIKDMTPFLYSAEIGDTKIFKKLLNNGGNINYISTEKATILTQSLWFEKFELTKHILENVDVSKIINVPNKSKTNALHMTILKLEERKDKRKILEQICDLLIEKGIDKNLKNNYKKSPIDLALDFQNHVVLSKLVEKNESGLYLL